MKYLQSFQIKTGILCLVTSVSMTLTGQNVVESKLDFTIPFENSHQESEFMEMGAGVFKPLEPGDYTLVSSKLVASINNDEPQIAFAEEDGEPLEVDCSLIFDQNHQCRSDLPPVDFDLVVIVHSVGPVIKSALTIIPGNSGCPGDEVLITRTYTSRDGMESMDQCMQTFTVSSTNPPTIVVPADITIGCDSSDPSNTGSATASATCSNHTASVAFMDVSVPNASGETITRTWTATDQCGNSSSGNQVIEVIQNDASCIDDFTTQNELNFGDPCICEQVVALGPDFFFGDTLTIIGAANLTINYVAAGSSDFYNTDGTDMPDGTPIIETPIGSGTYLLPFYKLDATQAVGFVSVNGGAAIEIPAADLEVCNVSLACPELIPTMGQWGIIILSLLLLSFAVVTIRSSSTENSTI